MSNGYNLLEIESLLERIFGHQLIGCGAEKAETRRECLENGGTEAECEEAAQRAFDNCLARQDALHRISNILRGVALKKTLLAESQRTTELWSQIFDDRKKAMIFSNHLAQAFKDAKIKLKENETFSCLLFVGKKPEYLSALIPPASQDMDAQNTTRLFQILEPKIMDAVLDFVEKDRIPK